VKINYGGTHQPIIKEVHGRITQFLSAFSGIGFDGLVLSEREKANRGNNATLNTTMISIGW